MPETFDVSPDTWPDTKQGFGAWRQALQRIRVGKPGKQTVTVVLAVLLLSGLAALAYEWQNRLAGEDQVRLAPTSRTSVAVDTATRTLLFDLVVTNIGKYAVTVSDVDVRQAGLTMLSIGINTGTTTALQGLPIRLLPQQSADLQLTLKPVCRVRSLPRLPAFQLSVRSARGKSHLVVVAPYTPLTTLWNQSVQSTCFDKPQ